MIRIFAAWLTGLLLALAGAAAYAVLLRRYSNFDLSIVTVLIGFMVGWALRTVTGARARTYQVLAVFLTYGAIAAAYIAVRASFLFYDGHPLTPAALRPFRLLVLPVEEAAREWLLGAVYALALVVAWRTCGRGTRGRPGLNSRQRAASDPVDEPQDPEALAVPGR